MKALLIDGFNLVRRIYSAIPSPGQTDSSADDNGDQDNQPNEHIEGVISACSASLSRALSFHQPSHAVMVFELGSPTWRHRLYPEYKKNRSPMPKALADALPLLKQAFSDKGVQTIERAGYEADDVIATMAVKVAHSGGDVIILSTDRHHCQLLGSHVRVYDHFAQSDLDRDTIFNRFGVEPHQLPMFFALAGDSSQSIPGIPSIGVRTAARLVNEYHDMDALLEAATEMSGSIGAKLFHGVETARLCLQLFTLKTDIELGINLNQFRYQAV